MERSPCPQAGQAVQTPKRSPPQRAGHYLKIFLLAAINGIGENDRDGRRGRGIGEPNLITYPTPRSRVSFFGETEAKLGRLLKVRRIWMFLKFILI